MKAEQYCYAVEFCKHSNNLKKTWNLILSIVKTGEQEDKIESLKINEIKNDDPVMMANALNEHIKNISAKIAKYFLHIASQVPPTPSLYSHQIVLHPRLSLSFIL